MQALLQLCLYSEPFCLFFTWGFLISKKRSESTSENRIVTSEVVKSSSSAKQLSVFKNRFQTAPFMN